MHAQVALNWMARGRLPRAFPRHADCVAFHAARIHASIRVRRLLELFVADRPCIESGILG